MFTFFLTLVEHIESQVTTESLFAAGDHVVQTGRTRGTVKANGASFDIPEVHVWELRDGKVVRYQAYHRHASDARGTEAIGRRLLTALHRLRLQP